MSEFDDVIGRGGSDLVAFVGIKRNFQYKKEFIASIRASRRAPIRLFTSTSRRPGIWSTARRVSFWYGAADNVPFSFAVDGTTLGWMVEGSPADSVKLGICELLSRPPDLIVDALQRGRALRAQRGVQEAAALMGRPGSVAAVLPGQAGHRASGSGHRKRFELLQWSF